MQESEIREEMKEIVKNGYCESKILQCESCPIKERCFNEPAYSPAKDWLKEHPENKDFVKGQRYISDGGVEVICDDPEPSKKKGFFIGHALPDDYPCFMEKSRFHSVCKQTMPPHTGNIRVLDSVLSDLKTRAEMGKKKYGHYLETQNGRNSLQDAYEECLDLCMYLKQRILEEEGK